MSTFYQFKTVPSSVKCIFEIAYNEAALKFCSNTIFPTLLFSSINCRVHTCNCNAPVFSTSTVVKHVSKPERWLVNDGWLLVYSINRFHF